MSDKVISAEEFDKKFDDGEDISEYIDFNSVRSLNTEKNRVQSKGLMRSYLTTAKP